MHPTGLLSSKNSLITELEVIYGNETNFRIQIRHSYKSYEYCSIVTLDQTSIILLKRIVMNNVDRYMSTKLS